MVAPHAGAWIEIPYCWGVNWARKSLPMRERGLKYAQRVVERDLARSLPMRERGLKFGEPDQQHGRRHVAPHAGAWIEINDCEPRNGQARSLPMRERGLKLHVQRGRTGQQVAPHAGAWIEIGSWTAAS